MTKITVVLGTSTDYLIGLTDTEEPKDINELFTYSDLYWNEIPFFDKDIQHFFRNSVDLNYVIQKDVAICFRPHLFFSYMILNQDSVKQ
jgi:hypothetical protein